MAQVTRRFFLLSSVALSVGCAMRRPAPDAGLASAQKIRQPIVGQSWRYAKHDLYTHGVVYDQIDRVAAIDRFIEIDSSNEGRTQNAAAASWGSSLLRKYFGHRARPAGALPGEIQGPWGMVSVDPHWDQLQVYETPIPLWPVQLQPGWQIRVNTKYRTPGSDEALSWDQTMKAHAWETVTVPAGRFNALRYTNSINFASGEFARTDSVRRETIWFATEVGRWVARESAGSYYAGGSRADQPYIESGYRWELLEWS